MKPYTWQTAILASSLPPTMRHVLLTLGCHLNVAGEACFPSTKLLAQETGLSERAVVTHLGNAKTLGWIVVRSHGLRGQKWRRHEYFPTIPKSAEALNEVQHQGTELDSAPSKKALNVVPKGAEPNDEKALNEVQSNSPYNYPRNSPVKIKHAGPVKKRKRKPELDLSRAVYLIGEAATADLLEYRRSIKKPLKQQGLNLLARKIQTASEENDMPTVDIVAEMDAAGWQGFEPHWLANRLSDGGNHEQNGRDRSSRNGKQAAVDRLLEANRRYVEQRGDAPISEPFSHC